MCFWFHKKKKKETVDIKTKMALNIDNLTNAGILEYKNRVERLLDEEFEQILQKKISHSTFSFDASCFGKYKHERHYLFNALERLRFKDYSIVCMYIKLGGDFAHNHAKGILYSPEDEKKDKALFVKLFCNYEMAWGRGGVLSYLTIDKNELTETGWKLFKKLIDKLSNGVSINYVEEDKAVSNQSNIYIKEKLLATANIGKEIKCEIKIINEDNKTSCVADFYCGEN